MTRPSNCPSKIVKKSMTRFLKPKKNIPKLRIDIDLKIAFKSSKICPKNFALKKY